MEKAQSFGSLRRWNLRARISASPTEQWTPTHRRTKYTRKFYFNIPDSLIEVFEFDTRLVFPNIGENMSYTHQISFLSNSAYAFRSMPAGVGKSYKSKLFLKDKCFMEDRGTKSAYISKIVPFLLGMMPRILIVRFVGELLFLWLIRVWVHVEKNGDLTELRTMPKPST